MGFMMTYSDNTQTDIIEASRYLDDLLNIENSHFQGMVAPICPTELQLNKTNSTDTKALCFELHLSISNVFVSSKIYVPFVESDVACAPSYDVYISYYLIFFAKVSSRFTGFSAGNNT